MKQSGKEASQCAKQKHALWEHMEWNLLEESD
jgi:hypothetical protein